MMGIESMRTVDPKTVDRNTLVQRSSVRLDPTAPREERLREFILTRLLLSAVSSMRLLPETTHLQSARCSMMRMYLRPDSISEASTAATRSSVA